jgi:aspartyl-tRNA synthetase
LYLLEIKPFYAMLNKKIPQKSHTFDLMYKDLEISSGAMKIHQHHLILEKMAEKGLNWMYLVNI